MSSMLLQFLHRSAHPITLLLSMPLLSVSTLFNDTVSTVELVVLGGLEVIVLSIGPKVREFKPGRRR
jgi:hypothetical protein